MSDPTDGLVLSGLALQTRSFLHVPSVQQQTLPAVQRAHAFSFDHLLRLIRLPSIHPSAAASQSVSHSGSQSGSLPP